MGFPTMTFPAEFSAFSCEAKRVVRSEGFWDISLSSNHATLLWQLEVDEVDGSWWEEVTSSAPDPVKDWGEITPLNGRK